MLLKKFQTLETKHFLKKAKIFLRLEKFQWQKLRLFGEAFLTPGTDPERCALKGDRKPIFFQLLTSITRLISIVNKLNRVKRDFGRAIPFESRGIRV